MTFTRVFAFDEMQGGVDSPRTFLLDPLPEDVAKQLVGAPHPEERVRVVVTHVEVVVAAARRRRAE